jgi:NAD(P)-dependent dehydrogenase (short-subunit alcohol dehydrogenase family)
MPLQNKIIVITGGSSGLGKALAIEFIKEGTQVVISSNNKNELKSVAQEIGATAFAADVTKENEVKNLAEETIKKFGRIDIWVNNAGIWAAHSTIEELDINRVHQMIEVNLFGTIYGSRAILPQMKKQGDGTIVNVVSMSSLVGRPNSSGYAASKWAARGFTESLRLAVKPENILVIGVHPDGIKTPIFGDHRPPDYESMMEPSFVAQKIVDNLKEENPEEELVIQKQ